MKKKKKEERAETLHVHTSSVKNSFYVLLLFIPSIVFVLVLEVFFKSMPKEQAATSQNVQAQTAKNYTQAKVTVGETEVYVDVADDEISRRKGLGGRAGLGEYEGMLFVFEAQDIRPNFWMKGMLIPIDIIWINDGKVAQIDKAVQPEPGVADADLTYYLPDDVIDYVLEVNAGFSEAHGIEVGDTVTLQL